MSETILEVKNLRTSFALDEGGQVRAVDDLSYTIKRKEFTAIVGESGSGKSVSVLSVMRLVNYPPGMIIGGKILYDGKDILALDEEEMRRIRGKEIAMIFQEPSAAMNPVMKVGDQIGEAIRMHEDISKEEAHKRAIELLRMVDIPNPEERVNMYPYEFSGGMLQRAMIAMAMSCNPKLLICDEPTTALDVTVQAQVLEQINHLREQFDTTIVLITHNLGVVARYADSVKVMYGGTIVEEGDKMDIFKDPQHPYTMGLIKAVPRLDKKSKKLYTIEGEPPDMSKIPLLSCAFADRCAYADDVCRHKRPTLSQIGEGDHKCACFHMDKVILERGEQEA